MIKRKKPDARSVVATYRGRLCGASASIRRKIPGCRIDCPNEPVARGSVIVNEKWEEKKKRTKKEKEEETRGGATHIIHRYTSSSLGAFFSRREVSTGTSRAG